jgi:hypothetical protein
MLRHVKKIYEDFITDYYWKSKGSVIATVAVTVTASTTSIGTARTVKDHDHLSDVSHQLLYCREIFRLLSSNL